MHPFCFVASYFRPGVPGVVNESTAATDEPIRVESREGMEAAVTAHDVVLVDYYADWCGPCKMLEPTVEALAGEEGVVVLKVDVDEQQALASEEGVRGVPTLEFYADGEPAERLVGVRDESALRDVVERLA